MVPLVSTAYLRATCSLRCRTVAAVCHHINLQGAKKGCLNDSGPGTGIRKVGRD